MVPMLVGPLGLGPVFALTGADTCGVSCACEQGCHGADAVGDTDDCDKAAPTELPERVPCKEHCPADCPDCSCCPGINLNLTAVPACAPAAARWATLLLPPNVPEKSGVPDVFHPPRSLN